MSAIVYLRAAAVHEAAHVMAAFHWNVPIGGRGVFLTPEPAGNHAAGFSDVCWNGSMARAECIGTLIAPFAEHRFWDDQNFAGYDHQLFYLGCSGDFCHVLKAGYVEVLLEDVAQLGSNGFSQPQRFASICGERLLRLWLEGNNAPGTNAATLSLVADTDALLCAYWPQIELFADVLLSATGYRLCQRQVIAWRDGHFQQRIVALTTNN